MEHIIKRHNKTLLMYHIVCPVKYRKKIFTKEIEESLKEICLEIEERYEIKFIEIGTDKDHVHFLVQSIPSISLDKIVKTIKGIISRELFKKHKDLKNDLWGGSLWTTGYYANTVGKYAGFEVIRKYVENQGKEKEYKPLRINNEQLTMFDDFL
jgi:REP element-mobilizing transposase RayT